MNNMAFLIRALVLALAGATATLFAATVPDQYIVELTAPSVAEHMLPRAGAFGGRAARARLSGAEAGLHRNKLHADQQQLRARLERRQARVLGAVEMVANAMFVEQAGDRVREQLAALPGVKRVLPMREFHRVMDRAIVVHKVTDAWAQLGDGRAGAGVKIAIIDTGVEASHPAFRDPSMTAPDGFPRMTSEADAAYTNGKIIVARSYASLFRRRDPDPSAADRVGHGTALAAIVAGTRTAGPLATISGIAPKAWIGNYKVFGTPGFNDTTTDAAILKAIDDAVSDGMDVINISLGSDLAHRLEEDAEVQAIERASRAGVVVVVSAGNNGPGMNTLASPGTAPSAITVGAVSNDRDFAASADVPGVGVLIAIAGSGPNPTVPVTAPVVDAASVEGGGGPLACNAFPANSMRGAVALILRGTCTFEIKLGNAQNAGAVAALVYATEQSPSPIGMNVGAATLPAEMIAFSDGAAIKKRLAEQSGAVATLNFTRSAVTIPAGRRTDFSAAGPNVDAAIKPDLVAVGSSVYTATQTLDSGGDMYSSTGFVLVDGTSFSSPIVAGAVALLKSARPGLTVDQYRSLVIDNTSDAFTAKGQLAPLQQTGAGTLDVLAALNSPVTAVPASLSFGAGSGDPRRRLSMTLANLGGGDDTFFIETAPRAGSSSAPVADSVRIAAGGSKEVPVTWNADGLAPGAYEGFLLVRSENTGRTIRVPYWYSVASTKPAAFSILGGTTSGRRGAVVRDAVLFRVLDASAMNIAGAEPEVTVTAGDGVARPVVSYDSDIPGLFGLTVQLGPVAGVNTFRIQAGEITTVVNITGQ